MGQIGSVSFSVLGNLKMCSNIWEQIVASIVNITCMYVCTLQLYQSRLTFIEHMEAVCDYFGVLAGHERKYKRWDEI